MAEIEWQPAIITWAEGEPRDPLARPLKGRRVYVRPIDGALGYLPDTCESGQGKIFEIREDSLPREMRWGRFHICEHDFCYRLKGKNSMAKGKKAEAAPEAEEKAPKQKRLPEMEDPAIEEIEDAALVLPTHKKGRHRRAARAGGRETEGEDHRRGLTSVTA